ncbi:MAG TPA: hypothetical protein VIJ34_08140 [Acidimicrobiales bacterium]
MAEWANGFPQRHCVDVIVCAMRKRRGARNSERVVEVVLVPRSRSYSLRALTPRPERV